MVFRMEAPHYKAIKPKSGQLQRMIIKPEVCLQLTGQHSVMVFAFSILDSSSASIWFGCSLEKYKIYPG